MGTSISDPAKASATAATVPASLATTETPQNAKVLNVSLLISSIPVAHIHKSRSTQTFII
jgi:hypothetical protein